MKIASDTHELIFNGIVRTEPVIPHTTAVTIGGSVKRQAAPMRHRFGFEAVRLTNEQAQTLLALCTDTVCGALTLALDSAPFGSDDTEFYAVFTSDIRIHKQAGNGSKIVHYVSWEMEEVLYL